MIALQGWVYDVYVEGAMADDSSTLLKLTYAMLSDVGRVRSGNEDVCAADLAPGVFVVCDGMGGAAAGEVASLLAAEEFVSHLKDAPQLAAELMLQDAVDAANARVHQQSRRPGFRGMGTTLVALTVFRGDTLWLTHVGDSRCYRLRGGEFLQLTRDHSFVEEQVMAGQLTPEQAEQSPMRNVITRAIGSMPEVRAETRRLHPKPDDLYLLSSDGLTRELPDAIIARLMAAEEDLEKLCQSLVSAANAAGGRDNVSVLLLRIGK